MTKKIGFYTTTILKLNKKNNIVCATLDKTIKSDGQVSPTRAVMIPRVSSGLQLRARQKKLLGTITFDIQLPQFSA